MCAWIGGVGGVNSKQIQHTQLTKWGALYREFFELCPAPQIGEKKWMEICHEVQEAKCYSNVYENSSACSFIPSGKYCGKSLTFLRGPLCIKYRPAMWPHHPGLSWLGQGWIPDPKVKGLYNGLVQGLCPIGVNEGHTNLMLTLGELKDFWRQWIYVSRLAKAKTERTCHHNDRAVVT